MKSLTVDGQALARVREVAGLTQGELAKKVGIDQSLISYWESGRRQPSATRFKKLCTALRVDADDLLASETEAA